MLSRWFYVVAAVIGIGGLAGSVTLGLRALISDVESMQRMVVPGDGELELKKDSYVAYFERKSIVDGKHYLSAELAGLECQLVGPSGPVPLGAVSVDSTYSVGSFQGSSLFELEVLEAGSYRLSCVMAGQGTGVLAIGPGIGGAIATLAIGAVGSIFGGLILFALVYWRRSRAKRQAQAPR